MDLTKLKASLKSLFDEHITTEQAEKLGAINSEIETLEKDINSLVDNNVELRNKYIEAVKNSTFKIEPEKVIPEKTQKSFEDCIQDQIDNRK